VQFLKVRQEWTWKKLKLEAEVFAKSIALKKGSDNNKSPVK